MNFVDPFDPFDATKGHFWLIWNPAGGAPTKPHLSERAALNEQERLARTNPGQTFVLLESVSACVKSDVQRFDLRAQVENPF